MNMNKHSLFFMLFTACALNNINTMEIDHTNTQQEDDFLSALFNASEDKNNSDADALEIMEALSEPVKETAEEPSVLKQYALTFVVRMITYYGYCKKYVKEWIAYIIS